MSTTPNMNMTLPDVSITPGPMYATEEVAAFNVIDGHDHTSGRGIQIPTAGLNINADLNLNSNNLQTIRGLRLNSQASTPVGVTDVRMVYSKNGELAYRDAAGNEVIITSGGSVVGNVGNITGLVSPASAVFDPPSGTFSFLKDTNKPAKVVSSDILFYEFDNASANAVTVKSPASLAAAYTLTLPTALPTQNTVMSISASGALSTGLYDGTASQPSLAFASELGTGLWKSSAGTLSFSFAGTDHYDITATHINTDAVIQAATGDATTPTYSYFAETNTGFYKSAAGQVSLTLLGTDHYDFNHNYLNSDVNAQFGDGLAASPAYSFSSQTNTGFWRETASTVGLSLGGVNYYTFGTTALVSASPLLIPDGVVGTPAYTFASDISTGMYRIGAGSVGFAGSITSNSTLNGAALNVSGGIQTASGGEFKIKTFSATSINGVVIFTVPGTVIGSIGTFLAGGPSYNNPIGQDSGAVQFQADPSSPGNVRVQSSTAGFTLNVIVFYQ